MGRKGQETSRADDNKVRKQKRKTPQDVASGEVRRNAKSVSLQG